MMMAPFRGAVYFYTIRFDIELKDSCLIERLPWMQEVLWIEQHRLETSPAKARTMTA
jgi:hypothetical protein